MRQNVENPTKHTYFTLLFIYTRTSLSAAEFWSSVNPITTRGADFAHHITASPPGFENPAASLQGM